MTSFKNVLARFRQRFPRLARWVGWFRPRFLWRRVRLLGKGREEVFTYILEKKVWDSSESISGAGSTLEATAAIREELPKVLSALGVRSLLDAPCGDFHWMKEMDLDLDFYIGGDIVTALVDRLNQQYGSDSRRFVRLDITSDPLPEANAFLCRDCLLHLSNEEVSRALDNALRSSCTYLLASTYPNCTFNADIRTGFSRPLNLCRPPFNLPEPFRVVADPGVLVDDKCLGVWDLSQLRQG